MEELKLGEIIEILKKCELIKHPKSSEEKIIKRVRKDLKKFYKLINKI